MVNRSYDLSTVLNINFQNIYIPINLNPDISLTFSSPAITPLQSLQQVSHDPEGTSHLGHQSPLWDIPEVSL